MQGCCRAPGAARRPLTRGATPADRCGTMHPDRRRFLLSVAGAAGLVPWSGRAGAVALRVGLVGRDDGGGTALGARLGAEEGARGAALFGGDVRLVVHDDARRLLDAEGAQVLVGGRDDAECERLSALAERGALFLNVGAAGDALRARCRPRTFHVAASESMRRAARRGAGSDGEVALWHGSLTRFGAAQLNDRFRARFGRAMDGDAWAAWMAVKVATEAALRARDAAPAALAAHLARPGVRFDGHKGTPLSFGATDHQLRQPLYLVRAGTARAVEGPP